VNKKRILLITADGRPGGGVTNVLQLCRGLSTASEWQVFLISDTGSYAVSQAKEICEVREVDFFRSRFDPRITWNLRRLIHELKPDIVHTHGSRAALPATYAIARPGPRLVHTVHGFHFHQKSKPIRYWAIRAERRIVRIADRTIFVCDNDRLVAERERIVTPATRHSTILHGINTHDLPAKVPHEGLKVALLARLTYQKHPEMLIEVADRMRDTDLSFVYIGSGELQGALEAEVARRGLGHKVAFTGSLPRMAALEKAASADIGLLPSRWEGFPIAVLEMMGMGIPMVAADVNGIAEIVADGVNGYLVPGGEIDTYVDRVRRLACDEDLRRKLGDESQRTVNRHFSESRMFGDHLDVYEACLADRLVTVSCAEV
jgi:glycosyltransferase involved in cell wall biosynthesis